MSAAAKREDIQKRLQDLRTQKQKEQEAFDQLANESEGLSPEEMLMLAREKAAKETVEASITVNGQQVAIGQVVAVRDSVATLQQAERGLLAPDPIKRVYLGETGKVIRVWHSFQGKPAVELRFADACTKIFFAECLELESTDLPTSPSQTTAAKNAARTDTLPRAANPSEPVAPPAPSWAALSLPGKSKLAAVKPVVAATPATAPTAGTGKSSEPAITPAPVADVVPLASVTQPAVATTAPTETAPRLVEGLGKPTDDLVSGASLTSGDAVTAAEMDDLLRTPRPDFLAASHRSGGAPLGPSPRSKSPGSPSPPALASLDTEGSHIPLHCPVNYQPKFPLHDPESAIPRCSTTGRGGDAAVRRRESPRVATSGVSTPKRGASRMGITPPNSVSRMAPRTNTPGRSGLAGRSVSHGTRPASAARPIVSATHTASASSSAANRPSTPGGTGAAAAAANGARKPIQVRIFENGLYDNDAYDRVYRTITIRPTYKTVASLRSMVGRELMWRDGRKVEVLYDASGAEVDDMAAIHDGQSLIASAGDRFVIPFPNSILHAEALRLSQQQ